MRLDVVKFCNKTKLYREYSFAAKQDIQFSRVMGGQHLVSRKRYEACIVRKTGAVALLTVAMGTCVTELHPADAAEPYPLKPLRVIVGFPPGGPVDLQARVIMQKLSDALHQPIVIDSRPGADGVIGNDLVAKSVPDGYTLLYGSASHVISQILRGKALPYDAIKDFAPVGLLTNSPYILVAGPAFPANNVTELIALAKARPGTLSYGSSGSGSMPHLAGEYLNILARITLLHIPYKGAAPALNDVLGGQIPLTFVGPPPVMPHIKSGRVRALAVTTIKRATALPDVSTIAEAGFRDYDVAAWYGFFAPANTAPAIVGRLNRELRAIVKMPDVRERLAILGLEPVGSTPAEHLAHLEAELTRWTPVVKAAGLKVD